MAHKKHIVHFISCLHYGGSEQVLISLLSAMDQNKYHHTVLYIHDGHHGKTLDQLGISRYQVRGLLRAHDPFIFVRAFWRLWHLKPDVLHTSLWMANFVGRIVGFFLRIPVVAAYHYHAEYDGSFRNKLDWLTGASGTPAVAASSATARSLQLKGIAQERVQVIINGVKVIPRYKNAAHFHSGRTDKDPSIDLICGGQSQKTVRPECSSELRRSGDECIEGSLFTIAMIARFHPVKNHQTVFKALALLKKQNQPFHVLLIGDFLPEHLEQQIKDLELQHHISILFNKPGIDFLPFCDCFILPSLSEGGISLALQEAMACALPCIISHEANTENIIEHEKNGLLIPACDENALAQALSLLITTPSLCKELGENGQKTLAERCSFDAMIVRYQNLFDRLCGS